MQQYVRMVPKTYLGEAKKVEPRPTKFLSILVYDICPEMYSGRQLLRKTQF